MEWIMKSTSGIDSKEPVRERAIFGDWWCVLRWPIRLCCNSVVTEDMHFLVQRANYPNIFSDSWDTPLLAFKKISNFWKLFSECANVQNVLIIHHLPPPVSSTSILWILRSSWDPTSCMVSHGCDQEWIRYRAKEVNENLCAYCSHDISAHEILRMIHGKMIPLLCLMRRNHFQWNPLLKRNGAHSSK